MKLTLKLSLLFIFIPLYTLAEKPHKNDIEKLSPELRLLLKKEMNSLQSAMNQVFNSYISGDMDNISNIAEKMKDSYILMQNLTEAQKFELHHLPSSFLELDQKFHDYAGMLEHVAYNKNKESIGFYYYKLAETCHSCHSQFAQHRFPLMSESKPAKNHGH